MAGTRTPMARRRHRAGRRPAGSSTATGSGRRRRCDGRSPGSAARRDRGTSGRAVGPAAQSIRARSGSQCRQGLWRASRESLRGRTRRPVGFRGCGYAGCGVVSRAARARGVAVGRDRLGLSWCHLDSAYGWRCRPVCSRNAPFLHYCGFWVSGVGVGRAAGGASRIPTARGGRARRPRRRPVPGSGTPAAARPAGRSWRRSPR